MELIIGEKLKKLRRERELTQEEVAAALGISFQAISKWERSDGYPDITMLPALANYFKVTVDELIGMNEIAAKDRLDEINREWEENRKNGRHGDNVSLMRDALKIYPNNALLLVQLSASLERLGGTELQRREQLRESIEVQERILRYCEDSEVRGAVMFNISDAYFRAGDREKAVEYARKLPNFYKTRENALAAVLDDDAEKHEVAKEALERIVWSLARQLTVLAETEGNDRYLRRLIGVLDVLYDGTENDLIRSIREKALARLAGK